MFTYSDMQKESLLFLDTETTGTGLEDRLCQVAYAFQGKEEEALFKPPVPISVDAMAVCHITNKMVADKEAFVVSKMYQDLRALLEAGNILVAHNAAFDVDMLTREGLAAPIWIDTCKVARALDTTESIPRYALQYLRYYYDLDVPNVTAHDALGDVRVLVQLFEYLYSEMAKSGKSEPAILEEMVLISGKPTLLRTFHFGKYNGQKVKVVAHEDPGYLAWLLNQKILARERGEGNDEDWIYTLDYYVNGEAKKS